MKKTNQIQRPGLRKRTFGSKSFLNSIQKKLKNNQKPKKLV